MKLFRVHMGKNGPIIGMATGENRDKARMEFGRRHDMDWFPLRLYVIKEAPQ